MDTECRFSTELNNLSELPEPLATVLRQNLNSKETVELLIYKPQEAAGPEISPPKALAVTNRGFVFTGLKDGRVDQAVRCEFDAVLLVELATLLLYGHLRIDYVQGDRRGSIAMEYNSVSHDLYRRAASLVLAGASRHEAQREGTDSAPALDVSTWPKSIRRATEFAMLTGEPAEAGAWWSSVRAGFGHELAPAGAVVARKSRLTVVTLEQSGPWDRVRSEPAYGIIATYLPSNRIARIDVHRTPKLLLLELEMHARHGGEQFQLAIPVDREAPIKSVVDGVLPRTGMLASTS